MVNQTTVTIEQWFTEGWKLYKRHPITFLFGGLLGALICIPPAFLFFAGPLYAGLYYMALKAMRGEKPRIRDIFKGFRRYWGALFLWWLSLIAFIVLCTTGIGILVAPLVWAIAMLAFPLLIDDRKGVGSAFGTALQDCVYMEELCAILAIWVDGAPYLTSRCFGVLLRSLYHSYRLAVCVQVIAYRDIFKPEGSRPTRGA